MTKDGILKLAQAHDLPEWALKMMGNIWDYGYWAGIEAEREACLEVVSRNNNPETRFIEAAIKARPHR